MRLILALIVAIALGMGVAWTFDRDPGVVVLSYEGWVVQTSLSLWLSATLLLALAAFLLFKVCGWLLGIGLAVRWWCQKHNEHVAQRLLGEGFERLAEGDLLEAERLFVKGAARAQQPVLHYLAAAQAADRCQDIADRDRYLAQARQAGTSHLAVQVTIAEIALKDGRLEDARSALDGLYRRLPRQPQVLRLLARLSELREDWQRIIEILPRLRSRHALPAADCDALETRAWQGLLNGASREVSALSRVMRRLPRRLQDEPAFLLGQARALVEADAIIEAESLLRRALARQWRADLLAAYAELPVRPKLRALEQAEAWLKDRPEDADLHACLARLCMHNSLWAQARRHLDLAIARRAEPRWLHWLTETLNALGEDSGAADASRRGLALAVGVTGRGLVGR
ncbi:MAG TPA: hypothetical protein DCY89_00235 [Gammaproteobacteria bacterium]|nr:hypothetical protein [Gammaproteobacteria bacterium]